jgi:NTP pyrophosphatase (non-canonical NTP hydrolase)
MLSPPCVGFDLDDTIAWRRSMASDQSLPAHARHEHEQMAEWLVELRDRRNAHQSGGLDMFQRIWTDQVEFMQLLQRFRGFPLFPVDLSSKAGQRTIKEIAQDAAGEVFEALAHLKNAKLHRATDVPELDRHAFVEELVDAVKLLIEVAILSGVSLAEFWSVYTAKTEKNKQRISEGY